MHRSPAARDSLRAHPAGLLVLRAQQRRQDALGRHVCQGHQLRQLARSAQARRCVRHVRLVQEGGGRDAPGCYHRRADDAAGRRGAGRWRGDTRRGDDDPHRAGRRADRQGPPHRRGGPATGVHRSARGGDERGVGESSPEDARGAAGRDHVRTHDTEPVTAPAHDPVALPMAAVRARAGACGRRAAAGGVARGVRRRHQGRGLTFRRTLRLGQDRALASAAASDPRRGSGDGLEPPVSGADSGPAVRRTPDRGRRAVVARRGG